MSTPCGLICSVTADADTGVRVLGRKLANQLGCRQNDGGELTQTYSPTSSLMFWIEWGSEL